MPRLLLLVPSFSWPILRRTSSRNYKHLESSLSEGVETDWAVPTPIIGDAPGAHGHRAYLTRSTVRLPTYNLSVRTIDVLVEIEACVRLRKQGLHCDPNQKRACSRASVFRFGSEVHVENGV